MKRMFKAVVENENRGLVKYLAFQPGMGWYLTYNDTEAYAFPRAGQRRVAELWQSERSKFFQGWSPKVTYIPQREGDHGTHKTSHPVTAPHR
jgi:hypothetical protein